MLFNHTLAFLELCSKSDLMQQHHEDVLEFLKASSTQDVASFSYVPGFFLYSLILPKRTLRGSYIDDLLEWNFGSNESYAATLRSGPPKKPRLSEPMENARPQLLAKAIPVFFERGMVGNDDLSSYLEINQKVSQVLNIHWIAEKRAWCRYNELGELVAVARYEKRKGLQCATLLQDDIDFLLYVTRGCLIRVFDIHRMNPDLDWLTIDSSIRDVVIHRDKDHETYGTFYLFPNAKDPRASVFRGFQIIRCGRRNKEMLRRFEGEEPRSYATFLISDWKHGKVVECSADPNALGNYFEKSDRPYFTSAAFFKADVLLQYRGDPNRYEIDERTIRCRAGWSLQYDVNTEGQIHAYIGDLGMLPFAEQLHWKAFNEPPRGGISGRAFNTDFLAQYDTSYDALRSLKEIMTNFPSRDVKQCECVIWRMPSLPKTRDIAALGYVLTESEKEWENQVQILNQLVVEGLHEGEINRIAKALNCRDTELRSIKQLKKVLEARQVSGDEIGIIIDPLVELQGARTTMVSHAGTRRPGGDTKSSYRMLVARCDRALRTLAKVVESGALTIA